MRGNDPLNQRTPCSTNIESKLDLKRKSILLFLPLILRYLRIIASCFPSRSLGQSRPAHINNAAQSFLSLSINRHGTSPACRGQIPLARTGKGGRRGGFSRPPRWTYTVSESTRRRYVRLANRAPQDQNENSHVPICERAAKRCSAAATYLPPTVSYTRL